jgi:hypothetical protein
MRFLIFSPRQPVQPLVAASQEADRLGFAKVSVTCIVIMSLETELPRKRNIYKATRLLTPQVIARAVYDSSNTPA